MLIIYNYHKNPKVLNGYLNKHKLIPMFAYQTARGNRARYPEIEPVIAREAQWSYYYARDVLDGPFPMGEPSILTDPEYAVKYAVHILKREWPEGEEIIMSNWYIKKYYMQFKQQLQDSSLPHKRYGYML